MVFTWKELCVLWEIKIVYVYIMTALPEYRNLGKRLCRFKLDSTYIDYREVMLGYNLSLQRANSCYMNLATNDTADSDDGGSK